MKEFYEENKRGISIALIMIIVTAFVLVTTVIIENVTKISKPVDILETLGNDYYENYIFPTIQEFDTETRETLLSEYSIDGIKVTARDLVTAYSETVDSTVFYRKGNYCNYLQTYVMIYPVYPYTEKDYRIETTTSCRKTLEEDTSDELDEDEPDGGVPSTSE